MSNVPSRNPAGNDSLPGLLKFLLKTVQMRTDICLPATVLAYSPSANRAQLSPALVQITTGNEQVPRGQLASIPVLQLGGGGFVMYYPIKTGDTGWIIACDRDISLFKKNYKQSVPNTYRLHDFADSWFIPDTMLNGVTLVDPNKMCLQSYDGTTAITMGGGKINIIAPTEVIVDAPVLTVRGVINVLNENTIADPFTVNGSIQVTGDVIADFGTTNISLTNHVHTGVQAGTDNTGPAEG